MPTFSREEVAALVKRRAAPVPLRPKPASTPALLEVFIPGNLPNVLNGQVGHWAKRARLRRQWRELTAQEVFVAVHERYGHGGLARMAPPGEAKIITFTLYVGRLRDDDSLAASCKPCRDALSDCHLIHEDGPASGHRFVYTQARQPGVRGVGIRIERLVSLGHDGPKP